MNKKNHNDTNDISVDLKVKKKKSTSKTKSDSTNEKNINFFKPSFRCTECCLIPLLTLKDNDTKISMNCSNGHFREMPINDYMAKGFQNNINNIKCSDCGMTLETKKRFKFCSECIKIFCKNCLKKHNNTITTTNHESICLRKMDTYCCLHANKFTHYCELCHKNICEDCFYLHNNHQILCLKEIKLDKNEIKELKENINKENKIIDKIVGIFDKTLNSLKKKFDGVIKNKKIVLEFKKVLEEIYEEKNANFQIIQNLNRLKFKNQNLDLEKNMNELDILFEIFNYLNCIDYNVETPNPNNTNSNPNSHKTNSSISNESKENKIKTRITINNGVGIGYFSPYDNKEFIYEKKKKTNIDNIFSDKEEERNESHVSGSSSYYNGFNKNDLYKKNIKYCKKRIKERINYKNNDKYNSNNQLINIENKENINYNNNIEEGLPPLNEIKKKPLNESLMNITTKNIFDSNILNNENKTNKSNKVNNLNINKISIFSEEDKENNINLSNIKDMSDKNLNINNEINNIQNTIKKTKKKKKSSNGLSLVKSKSTDKIVTRITSEEVNDNNNSSSNKENEDINILTDRAYGKLKDKSKERRIKIKKEIHNSKDKKNEKIDLNILNRSFDILLNDSEYLHFNSFKDNNKVEKEEEFNAYENETIYSERSMKNRKKRCENKNLKLVNKNYYKEKSTEEFDIIKNKELDDDKDDKNENEIKNKNNRMNLKEKINNIFYEINEKNKENNNNNEEKILNENNNIEININNKNNINEEKINNENNNNEEKINHEQTKEEKINNNDISNDNINNYLSNDDVSAENSKEKKIKIKRKKKIVKKKKKIKKINVLSDDSLNNILIKSNTLDTKEKLEIKNCNTLNTQQIFAKEIDFIPKINNGISKEKEKEISPNINTSSNIKLLSPKIEKIEPSDKIEIINTDINKNIKIKRDKIFSPFPPTKLQQEEKIENKTKTKKTKKKLVKKKKKKNETLSKSVDDLSKTIIKHSKKPSFTDLSEKKIQRSNSFDIINRISELDSTKKINSMKFDIGISSLLEVSQEIFAAGNLIGDIKIIERNNYKEIQSIREHNGTINSLFKLQDGAILSTSADKFMKKIRLINYNLDYEVEFVFSGYNNYIFKAIELSNNKIISCSWDDKLYLWEGINNKYKNTLKFNENQRVEDILEITKNKFCSVAENELKIWDSNTISKLHSIKLQRGIISPTSLCKVNDEILISIFYNAIHLIDLVNFRLINTISMDQCSLSCITKLNDGSILIAEDINTDNYCIFYLKQFVLEGDELQYISFKKDKFYKFNKNNDREIRALIQFSDDVIAQGIAGEYNGKDSGDIFFYE